MPLMTVLTLCEIGGILLFLFTILDFDPTHFYGVGQRLSTVNVK